MGGRCMEFRLSRFKVVFAVIFFPREVDDESLLLSPDRWDNLPEAVKSLPGVCRLSPLDPVYDIFLSSFCASILTTNAP
jgi:hypothetical protein